MAKDKIDGLTDKQKLFCHEYLKDLNGTQSAIRCGYSPNTAQEIASENLSKPIISAYVNKLKAERVERTDITADKVLKELARVAFSDLRKVFGPDGQLLPIQQIDDESAGAISAIKSYEEKLKATDEDGEQIIQGTNREIKLHDKMKALELIGKHIGFFEKDNSQLKPITTPQLIVSVNGKTIDGKLK